jgi:hypothetical protein
MKVGRRGLEGVVRKLSPDQGQQKLAAEARPRSALRGYGLAIASLRYPVSNEKDMTFFSCEDMILLKIYSNCLLHI